MPVSFQPGVERAAAPPDDWWRLYGDPVLDALVEAAFSANYDLKAAQANLAAARAMLEGARIASYPQTKLSAGAMNGRNANVDLILELTKRPPETNWIYDASLDMSYELDLFGRVRHSIEAATARAQAVAAARDDLRITVAAETVRTYLAICSLGEQISIARHSAGLVAEEEGMIEARKRVGASSDFDLARAQALVASVRAGIPALEGARQSALFQLAVLTGHTPSEAPTQALGCMSVPHLAAEVPVDDGAALLARRPDVRAAERALAASTAEVGVATADLFPRVRLLGIFGGITNDFQLLGTSDALTWGIGPSVSWDFPNIEVHRAALHRAKANAAAAVARFDAVVLKALRETEQALTRYGAERHRQRDLLEFQAAARRAYQDARRQFASGAISNLDLLTAEQSVVNADGQVARSEEAISQDEVAVFKALGGGLGRRM